MQQIFDESEEDNLEELNVGGKVKTRFRFWLGTHRWRS